MASINCINYKNAVYIYSFLDLGVPIMLTALSINNFAVIGCSELEFSSGMTAVTGETGAGKSIMIDALKFAMGDRVSREIITKDGQRTEVQAIFNITGLPYVQKWLKSKDLDHGDECILRRILTSEGRSRGYINGISSTMTELKQTGELLLQLHGQHDHQLLLQNHWQRELLDNYSGCENQARKVRQLWQAYMQCRTKIKNFNEIEQVQIAQKHLLRYQVQEINALELQKEELPSLEKERRQLSQANQCLETCQYVQAILSGSDYNAIHQMGLCVKQMSDVSLFGDASALMSEAIIQLEEATNAITRIETQVEINPVRLTETEQRLSSIYDIARKHHIQPAKLTELQQKLTSELNHLETMCEDICALEQQMKEVEAFFLCEARKLSQQRHQGASKLTAQITCLMKELAFSDYQFKTNLSPLSSPDSSGMDKVTFQIKSNESNTGISLGKIVSGGELSRISLAIQIATARRSGIQTLIFDEVDVGIGGATAEIVGRLLRQLGNKCQVVCITHQAQVASQAHHHLSAIKKRNARQYINLVKTSDNTLREQEVARMIAGVKITGQALAHAKDMINRAQS